MKRFFLPSLLVVVSLLVGVGLLGQGRPVTAQMQEPSFSIDPNGPSVGPPPKFHPADILGNPGAPVVGIPCLALGLWGCGLAPPFDDLDALSYGADFTGLMDIGYVGFSVDTGSWGQPGTAVDYESSCTPPEPEADEFSTILDGNNSLVYDGDGIDCVTGAPVPSMGLVEVPQPPPSDDLDALDDHNYTFVDSDGNTIPDRYVYFSLQPGSLTLDMSPDGAVGGLTWSPADILVTIAGMRPNIYAGFGALGLVAGDDVDGLCLAEVAMDDYFDPIGGDVLFYTITPGSPSATPAGWIDPGDIMYVPTPGVAVVVDEAAALGLLDSDDLNAIKCVKGLVDISIETFTVTLPDGTVVNPGDDVTMNMKVSEWATLTVEESKHYVGEEPGELNPPQVWSQVWWAVLGADPSQLNVRWVPAPGDICTFDGEEVDCVDGDPATGDINDLEFEVLLPWCDPQTVTREVEVHCKASTEDPAEPFTITFENVEMPLGANDLDQSNNASYIDLTIACENAPENPSFTVGESIIPTPSGANPGDILRLNGQKFAPPVVGIPCQNLGLNPANCAAQLNDLNSLSYGAEPALAPEVIPDFKFSITEETWPDGLPGTDVNLESTCMAAPPGQAHGDEFDVDFPLPAPGVGGTNTQVLDENGIQDAAGCVVPPGYPVGTPLPGDDINGLVEQGADYVDTDGDTIPENPVYFTLDAGSADLAGIGTEADILMTQNGLAPVVWASAAQLGLVGGLGGPPNADEIDALCIYEDGDDVYNPLIDIVWLSLAPGSPTLGPLGATAADVLASRAGAVSIVHQADQLGLEHPSVTGSTDNLNAMKCWLHEPAMPTGTLRIEKYDQGGALVGGATFTINPDPADGVGPTITVTDGGAGDPDGMADGIISLTAVPTSYTVTETVPPPGCTMTGPNPQVAVVTAAATTIVSFSDICEVPPAHYKCYDMIGPGPAPGVTVDLETQFGVETGVEVLDPLWLCPPALKDGEGDLTDTHLKCYQIDSSDDPDVTVNLTTQFGVETDVEVGPAGSLCVPALKEVVFPAPEPPPPGPVPPAPHYKCYSILGHSPGAPVDLETQFGFEPGVTVYDAEALCVPALKDGLGDLNAPHLKCYYISPGDIPDHIVNLETQFGLELDVGVGEGRYLCVEAIKEIVEPVDAHYKCYDIYPQDAPPVPFVELETQFGTDLVEVGPNTELCAPAVKDGEGDLTDPHLKCYDIWGGDPDVVVNLTTQFGLEENVEVGPARLLCMGAAKQVTFPPPVCCECPMYPMCFDATTIDACVAAGCMPVPDAGCVDPDIGICEPLSPQPPADLHYECFDILATGHDPPDVVGLLQTQFGLEFDVDVGPAELLCAPAKKEGIGTLDAPHLKCYQIRLEYPGEYWVNLETQWGYEEVTVGESRWLCAEATKEIVEPEVQDPTFSIARGGPSTPAPVDPADLVIRTLPGGVWPPTVVWPCGPGGFNWPNCGGPDDVNALSLGFDFVLPPPDPANPNAYMYFSVAPGSIGVLGTGVNNETLGCVPEPEADEFGSVGAGSNYQYFDGDGAASCANPGAPPLGLSEPPPAGGPSDDLDAVDPLNLNASGPPIFVTLEQNSPSLYIMPGVPLFSAADIVVDFGAGVAGWYATAPQLGLDSAGMNTDDIDALCIHDADGDQVYTAGVDTVWFSLTAGSASLGANSPADVFAAPFTGKPARTAAQLGLLPTDELNALKCYEVPPCIDREGDTQCDDPVNDPDDDGCADVEEQVGAPPPAPGATGAYDPTAWYDFYDVPVPAKADTAGANGTRNKAVAMDDVLAVLFYVGTYAGDASDPPNANGVRYDTIKGVDLDGDTVNDIPPPLHPIKEGVKYDRSPSALPNPPWDAGPPSGAVAMDDVLAVLAQVGLSCIAAP